ncbi:MAG: hypothetical protein Q9196_005269, partial [Gyalolechia fulgens]
KPSSTAQWYGVWQYDKEKLGLLANAISTLLASLLPSVSILVLYFLSKPVTRLVAILRIEVFAATTA